MEIKNLLIAAIVAAIKPIYDSADIAEATKKILGEQITALYKLDQEITDAVADNEALEQANEVIADLKGQLAAALNIKASKSDFPVGEVAGEKYQVVSGAFGYGSAEEIANDEAKMKKILAKPGQQIIVPLT